MPPDPRPRTPFLTVDRDLPVSIHAQLVGQIEYGVASGRLPPGSQLPSVRELAEQLSLSPVTVSHVFRALRERELIETVQGRGTFVARQLDRTHAEAQQRPRVHQAVDDLVRVADAAGMSRDELAGMVALRLRHEAPAPRDLRVRLVGIFREATRDYALELQRGLGPRACVDTILFEDLAELDVPQAALADADLLLTFPHRRADLERLAPDGPPVGVLRFIPSARVRTRLAELTPFTRIGLVSAVPEFLPTFLKSVQGFAQHVREVRGTVQDAEDLDGLLAASDVVIYATGAQEVARRLPTSVPSFEYRHAPDPVWLDEHVRPMIDELARSAADGHADAPLADAPATPTAT